MGLTLLLALAACSVEPTPPPISTSPLPMTAPEPQRASAPSSLSWTGVLAELDDRIQLFTTRVAARPAVWTDAGVLANLYRDRFRLTSDVADLVAAERVLDTAFAQVVEGTGPWMAHGSLMATLHRSATATASLDRAAKRAFLTPVQRAGIARLRGDLALQTGRYDDAEARYAEALARSDSASNRAAAALLAWRLGDPQGAQDGLEAAEQQLKTTAGEPRAWLALQLGSLALERGQLAAARTWYGQAEAALPGWWAVDAYLADVDELEGERFEALRRLRRVVDATPHPEYLARLAQLEATDDLLAGATRLAEAEARYAEWLALAPEATLGHAASFAVAKGDAPADALALARRYAAAQPNGEARVVLARALLKAGDVAAAKAEIEGVLATRWRTPALHRAAAAIYRRADDDDRATHHDAAAESWGTVAP